MDDINRATFIRCANIYPPPGFGPSFFFVNRRPIAHKYLKMMREKADVARTFFRSSSS